MPINDPKKKAALVKLYRERMKHEPAFIESEIARKARWYEANREKKNANQQRIRQEKREQLLKDMSNHFEK